MDRRNGNAKHANLQPNPVRVRDSAIAARLSRGLSCLTALGLLGSPGSSIALDGRLVSGTEPIIRATGSLRLPAHGYDATTPEASQASTLNQWLKKTLASVPLRPIRIGETPRRPDDPEPGMGLVLRLPF
ncbi:hypothetical protein MK280_17885 [Myxococcota bacterium]|nr:hypothetical protein [Myxococcota bacterium]